MTEHDDLVGVSAAERPGAAPRSGRRRSITRRRFLTGLGVAATAAAAGGYGLTVWQRGGYPAKAAGRLRTGELGHGDPGHTLVVVEMNGGNDGINTVVPLDAVYHDLRPTLGVKDPIEIDGQFGLHPNLAKLAARYKAGHVAIVEGVGYPDPNLSHFASLDTWWTAEPGGASSGWLGRFLDGTVGFDDPLAGVSIGPNPSAALLGEKSFATSISDATGLQPRVPPWVDGVDDLLGLWKDFAPADVDPTTVLGRLDDAIHLTDKARADLGTTLAAARIPSSGAGADAAAGHGRAAGSSALSELLALAAQLVVAKSPPRVVYVTGWGDFDTHQGEAQRHPALMTELDAGLDELFATLDAHHASDRVVVMTVSEFGRRAHENGSGTDHGTAAPHFFIGPKVKGGRYGQPPDLRKLDRNGDFEFAVDFRSIYATALRGWLGVDPAGVLGRHYPTLAVFS